MQRTTINHLFYFPTSYQLIARFVRTCPLPEQRCRHCGGCNHHRCHTCRYCCSFVDRLFLVGSSAGSMLVTDAFAWNMRDRTQTHTRGPARLSHDTFDKSKLSERKPILISSSTRSMRGRPRPHAPSCRFTTAQASSHH